MLVLVITGSLGVMDNGLAATAFRKNGAKTIVIPGVAHMPDMKKGKVFNKEVPAFLQP